MGKPLQEAPALGSPRALVLAPTRELALQIESDAMDLSKHMNLQLLSLVGGMDFEKQQKKLEKRAVDLVVATPGRLIDFIERRQINLRKVETLVIDEADRMLDMGFIPTFKNRLSNATQKTAPDAFLFSNL